MSAARTLDTESQMNYRKLGKYGVRLSEVGLGSWITYGGTTDEATSVACVRKAWDLGVNFFDTADVYQHGTAETILGRVLKDIRRSDCVLATKCYSPMSQMPNDRGLSRKHIFESIHLSLRRLGTDYVDLYQCHRYDEETPLEETVRAMDDLVRQGKILYWGVSMWFARQMARACRLAARMNLYPPASDQPCYNMIDRDVEYENVLAVCAREGMGILVFSPLAQGVLTGKYKAGAPPPSGSRATTPEGSRLMRRTVEDQALLARVERLRPIAHDLGCTMAQLALAWVLWQPEVATAIIGATHPGQVEENVKAGEIRLSGDVLARIDAALGVTRVKQVGQALRYRAAALLGRRG